MTLTLTPEAEANLTAVAILRGLPPEDALAEARFQSEREQQEAIDRLGRSDADFDTGRSLSLEELRAHTDAVAVIGAKRRESRQQASLA